MASCEMCGKECKKVIAAKIDGVQMMVCHDCVRHGQAIQVQRKPSKPSPGRPFPTQQRKPRDVFQKMEKELVSDWSDRIQNARDKKGLSREELGFRIGERTVTISKMENGDLRPSDKTAKKLEKELDITLFEQVEKLSSDAKKRSFSGGGYTLGDFIKTEDE